MNLTSRQEIGAGLIVASLLAAIAIQVATGDLVHISTTEEPPVKGPIGSTQVIIHKATFTWRCKWKGTSARIRTFCRVSATPSEDIQIFGEYGTDVEIYFGLCRMCGTIVAANRCT